MPIQTANLAARGGQVLNFDISLKIAATAKITTGPAVNVKIQDLTPALLLERELLKVIDETFERQFRKRPTGRRSLKQE